ncbi:hypothetical protein CsatB_026577 [Cannabis sativa]
MKFLTISRSGSLMWSKWLLSSRASCYDGKVVVIRGEGPKGGLGMPEMLVSTYNAEVGESCF